MKYPLLLLAILWLAPPVHADDKPAQVPLDPAAGTYEIGDYRYVLSELATNEGRVTQVGTLYRKGLPVAGDDYFRLELPIGSFIWHPPMEGEPATGWSRINPEMKHPRWSMALIEPAPAKDAKFLRTMMRDPIPKDVPRGKAKVEEKGPDRFQ